jgi:hypothetical protein
MARHSWFPGIVPIDRGCLAAGFNHTEHHVRLRVGGFSLDAAIRHQLQSLAESADRAPHVACQLDAFAPDDAGHSVGSSAGLTKLELTPTTLPTYRHFSFRFTSACTA